MSRSSTGTQDEDTAARSAEPSGQHPGAASGQIPNAEADCVEPADSDRPVAFTVVDGVATILMNSQMNRNALSAPLVAAVLSALKQAAAVPEVHAVVLGHLGSTFCSGADLLEARDHGMRAGTERMLALLDAILHLPVPVIAHVEGHVRAGGMGIVGACDLVVAGPAATFAFTEARMGLAPAVIALTVLPRMTPAAASLYLLTGRVFDAEEGQRMGLVTVTNADAGAALSSILAELRRSSRQGLEATKQLLTASVRAGITAHGEQSVQRSTELFGSEVAQAAMGSFLAGLKT